MTDTKAKDFFISYTGHDRSWAEWVAWTLEEAGYSVIIQAWDFRPGGNFVLDMQQATQASHTIAVLSALYLDKPFPQSEWAAAFAQDPTSRNRKLIPVRVEDCTPPGLLAQIVYVDIFDCEEGEAKERLLGAIAEGRMKPTNRPRFPGSPPERVPFPGSITHFFLSSSSSSPPDPLPSARSGIPLSLSTYDESTWVGRDDLISALTQKLKSRCRILTILGITGIGKTALAERVVVGLKDRGLSFQRLNFDDRGQGRDFLSGALALLPKLGEVVTPEDQKDAQNAFKHLLQVLRTKPFLVQIDSLEMLLEGDEQQGWNTFSDGLWLDFFQQLLAGQECQSQLFLTTQALPEELEIAASRYPRLWHLQSVGGLSEAEQLQLFDKNGLQPDEVGTDYLKRIGKLYDGHPLVLQVIAKDILGRPFNGNVAQYWQRYQGEFDEAEIDRRQKVSSPRALQLRVKKRVEESLTRLPKDAYKMLCRVSVYRRPVPEFFWLKMLGELSDDRQWLALERLKSHNLIEEEFRGDSVLLLRQHSLVKGVARQLLRSEETMWKVAEQTAAQVWLREYEPEPDVPNIERLRGQLESFHHHCEVEDWQSAKGILIDQGVGVQLQTWSYYREMLLLYQQLLGKLGAVVDVICELHIGNVHLFLGNCPQSIEHYQKSLEMAREISDHYGEGRALGGLGRAYQSLGNYAQAIEYHQQYLTIAREISDHYGEGRALSGLGRAHQSLGNYSQAIEYHQQRLMAAREMGNREEEGRVLGHLGSAYHFLGNYAQAIEYHQQHLVIAREIGERRGEGIALDSLGRVHHSLGNYAQAIEYHQQSLTIACEVCDRIGEGNALSNLGLAYDSLGNHKQAAHYRQQLLITIREVGDRLWEGIELEHWGEVLLSLKQYSDAQPYLQLALDIFKSLGYRKGEAKALLKLGELHHKIGQPDPALDYCNLALSIATELDIPLIKECENLLATLLSEKETA